LLSSVPADAAVVEAAPTEITFKFSGQAVTGADSFQVFAPDRSRVDRGAATPTKGTSFSQPVDASIPGTYGVAYRVSSEDGHVITGAFSFAIGEPSDGSGAADASQDAASLDRGLEGAFSIARFTEVLALLAAAGGGIFATLIAPGWRPRILVPAILALLAAYAVGFVINTAIASGSSIGGALDLDALRASSDTPFALSLQIRALIAVVALATALVLRHGQSLGSAARVAVAVVFAALGASLSITGHAVTTEPMALRMPLDMVHVGAAAIWIGGLIQLGFLAPFAASHLDAITRFSRVAFASVAVLLVTGAYATYAELGLEAHQLIDSTYGRLILAKLLLYAATMPLAWNNMSAFVPAVRRRPEDAPRMLQQYVWREFGLLVVVLGLTVWLIATPQPG